ncbi:MAG: HAD-IB family phosphatase [Erysipelotrichaceae bacterium]|nr:HAD-IB family phosphatase [Erysipelotrichaceae bacterium]
MNVYDFDKTIYVHDSTMEFLKYCIRKQPLLAVWLPKVAVVFLGYRCHLYDKTKMKESFYTTFLPRITDIDEKITAFWDEKESGIKSWYLHQQKADDVIISASPEFLIKPICERLHISYVLASRVDPYTGKYTGLNCHGEEKVRRFEQMEWYGVVDEFYSDSYSDTPLARLAVKKAVLVDGDNLSEWKKR